MMSPNALIAYAALGSNMGDSKTLVCRAIEALAALEEVFALKASPLYRTSPVGPLPQNSFINGVVSFKTTLSCLKLFENIQRIERKLGKKEKPKWAPRLLDIDLLFFGDQACHLPSLTLPHPRWKERLFVLQPLSDLASTVSVEGKTYDVKELINQIKTKEKVQRL